MEKFKWNKRYSVNVKAIDDEHKKVIAIINKSIDANQHNGNPGEIYTILSEMTCRQMYIVKCKGL